MGEPLLISEDYIIVIDTDHFAGPFAEQLCAYVTGYYGEKADNKVRNVSDLFYRDHDIADDDGPKGLLAEDKNPFHGYISDQMNEEGCYSPVAVWPSRKYGVNASGDYAKLTDDNYDDYNFPAGFSVGIFFSENPAVDLVKTVKDRTKKFFEEVYPSLKGGTKVVAESFRLITHRKTAEETSI